MPTLEKKENCLSQANIILSQLDKNQKGGVGLLSNISKMS